MGRRSLRSHDCTSVSRAGRARMSAVCRLPRARLTTIVSAAAPIGGVGMMAETQPFAMKAQWIERREMLVRVTGELDVVTAPVLAGLLECVTADRTAIRVVVDLSEVSFLGVAGLRVLAEE